MNRSGVLAIDQGTTGTTVILDGHDGQPIDKAYKEFTQHYPQPGWVEHDPEEIWQTVQDCVSELLSRGPAEIQSLGITNQRETTVVWDRKTGNAVMNAIVWQCRRTAPDCEKLAGQAEVFTRKTGLPLDAYFSGTKIAWILENADIPEDADLAFGTRIQTFYFGEYFDGFFQILRTLGGIGRIHHGQPQLVLLVSDGLVEFV